MALKFYEKASKLDFAPAMYNRAFLHFKMARNTENLFEREEYLFECIHWLRICLDQNDNLMDAHFLMGYIYEKGIQVDKDLMEAMTHY